MSVNTVQSLPRQDYSFKAYHSGNEASVKTKALGNPALLDWLEEARDYYRGVMNGEYERPDPNAWQEFLNQKQWAEIQAFGNGGGDPGMDLGYEPEEQGPTVNAYEGEMGENGGWHYDMVHTDIGFTGDNSRNDVYGSDNTLTFEQPSAKSTFEMTMDHGVQVLKVTTTTSKGTMVTYYDSWESADFKLNVLQADETKVSGLEALPAELQAKINVEKYDPNKKPEEVLNQASITGKPVEGEENAYYYEVETVDQCVDFRLKAGDNETHYVVGDSNVSLPVSSHADVTEGPFEVNGDTYDYRIVVTHNDDSTDTIYVKKPFKVNVNAVEGYTTFNGEVPAEGAIPEAFEEIFTLNGEGTPEPEVDDRYASDTQPDDVDATSGEAIYNRSENVELHANFSDDTRVHRASLPGTFTLHTDSYEDTVEVNKLADGSYQILVFKGGVHDLANVEIYFVNGASEIIIDALPENISGDAVEDEILTQSLAPEPSEDSASEWPAADQIISNIPTGLGHNDDWHGGDESNALTWANMIDEQIKAGDAANWSEVERWIGARGNGHDQGSNGDDIIRKFLTGLYLSAGSDREKFLRLLELLPPSLLNTMKGQLINPTERQDGDAFNDAGFVALINESLAE